MLGNLDKYQIILASNSPRRKELMSGLGVDYVVRTLPDVDESYPADLAGAAIPEYISREKADAYRIVHIIPDFLFGQNIKFHIGCSSKALLPFSSRKTNTGEHLM